VYEVCYQSAVKLQKWQDLPQFSFCVVWNIFESPLEKMSIFHVALMSQFIILLPQGQKETGNQVILLMVF